MFLPTPRFDPPIYGNGFGRDGQCSILGGVRRELVQAKSELFGGLGVDDNVRPARFNPHVIDFLKSRELNADKFLHRHAAPVALDQGVMGGGKRLKAVGKARLEFLKGLASLTRLIGDRQYDCEQILRPILRSIEELNACIDAADDMHSL